VGLSAFLAICGAIFCIYKKVEKKVCIYLKVCVPLVQILTTTTTNKVNIMKVTRLEAGEYKVTTDNNTYIVAKLYHSSTDQFTCWEVWDNFRHNDNCWAHGFDTKREAIEAIAEIEGNQ